MDEDDTLRAYFFIWYKRRVQLLLYSLLRILQTTSIEVKFLDNSPVPRHWYHMLFKWLLTVRILRMVFLLLLLGVLAVVLHAFHLCKICEIVRHLTQLYQNSWVTTGKTGKFTEIVKCLYIVNLQTFERVQIFPTLHMEYKCPPAV